jgi:hypothetical protein
MAEDNKKDEILLNILKDIKSGIENAINILGGEETVAPGVKKVETGDGSSAKIVEGVFAGDAMIGSDGERYSVPPNYASKSKLVEGDILKLTVTSDGRFIFKQIGPIARKRLVGELIIDPEHDEHWVVNENDKWRVLKASVTYFKGESGDKVAILVPQDGPAKWAAVENVIKEE